MGEHRRIKEFTKAIFKTGQTVPANEIIEPRSYVPNRTVVATGVQEVSHSLRTEFVSQKKTGRTHLRGAVTVDGVYFKVQGDYFHEFTVNFIETKGRTLFMYAFFVGLNYPTYINDRSFVANPLNIREAIKGNLSEKCCVAHDDFMSDFRMVADRHAIIAYA